MRPSFLFAQPLQTHNNATECVIAAALFFSEHTVKAYVSRILHKLHLARRSEAAAFIAGRTARAAAEPYGGIA